MDGKNEDYSSNQSRSDRKRLKKLRKEQNLIKKAKKNFDKEEKEEEKTQKPKSKKLKNAKTVEESCPDRESTAPGKHSTVSIALAGSILDYAQSPPLRAYLAGQIARAAAIFKVDEVIIFDDTGGKAKPACEQMARILQFMECPQYLRKYLFPLHPDLKFSGVMNSLDIPHHLRKDEVLPYREGAVSSKLHKDGGGSFVYIGLENDVQIDQALPENTRVTVKLDNPDQALMRKGKLKGKLVSPNLPKKESGIYWGYSVRIASSLKGVFEDSVFGDEYDVTIGTSEKGSPVSKLKLADFKRLLIVFGGVEGLEFAFDNDESAAGEDVSSLFHHYVNTCPAQGSRTIRTEEAILISLTALAPVISPGGGS